MRRLLTLLFFLAHVATAHAVGCAIGALPFNLQNNTVADATQVMANLSQITNGLVANCASSGNNDDITSLNALTTPISPSQGGSLIWNGGFAAGVNSLVITATPSNFSLTTGYRVSFIASSTSTATATANVSGTGIRNVFRKTHLGAQPTQGGELVSGGSYSIVYDGTEYVLDGETVIVGEMRDWAVGTVTPPPGWLIADGSSFVCATLQQLCNVIGTTYGGSSSNPNLPDTRGRVLAGLDNYTTAAGAANRLTTVVTGCGSTFSIGVSCANASQSHVQVIAELAQHNHTDSGHTHTLNNASNVFNNVAGGLQLSGTGFVFQAQTITANSASANIQNTGSSQAMPIVNPNLGVVKIIRF